MKPITLIMLIALSVILVALLSACVTVDAANDSQHVAKLASKIAEFDLPAGYTPELSAEMAGYTFASYRGSAGPSHLFLIQSEKAADGPELEKMLKQLAPGSSDPNTRMTVIENHTATVRGQQVNVVISEGLNSDNVSYRQVTVGFQGKGGPAMLVFSETVENWDQDVVDALLRSIQ